MSARKNSATKKPTKAARKAKTASGRWMKAKAVRVRRVKGGHVVEVKR